MSANAQTAELDPPPEEDFEYEEYEEEEPEDESFKGVEEMTVEARRRSENIQKIGESVSSFSSNDILDKGLINFNDLQYNVPSLFSGGGLTKITLRGVGSEVVGPGIDPGFAVHVNGVFSAREGTGLIAYYDIERVDVLRGPQGTLWGRNSTGGAVNIVTKKAEHEFDAAADLEYDWYDNDNDGLLFRGMINMPVVEDTLAVRVAFLTSFDDGHMLMSSDENHQRVSDTAASTIRASIRWEPNDDVTVDLIGSWVRSNGSGAGQKFSGDYTTPPGNRWAGAGAGIDFTGADANPNDPYKGTADEPQRSDSTVWTASLLINWELDDFAIDSISGYQSTDFFIHRDQDTSNLPISVLELTDESRQVSQEIVINSTWDYDWDYTVGSIYQYDWTPQTLVDVNNQQNVDAATAFQLFPGLIPPPLSFVDGCPPPTPGPTFDPACPPIKAAGDPYDDFTHALAEVDNHVFGLYANVSWEFIESLTLSVGGRFSYTYRDWKDDTVAQTYLELATFPLQPPVGLQVYQIGKDQDHSWMSGTYKVGLEWEATDENLFWVSVGTGSRAGGFNFSEKDHFDDEEIFAVEAGIKNTFFDNRLLFNVNGFYYDWDDPQIGATSDGLPLTTNAGSAISYGIEVEWNAFPIDNLALDGTFGWLEAEYDSDFFEADSTIQDFSQFNPAARTTPININGNRMPRSPRFSVSVGGQYTIDMGRYGTYTPRVDFYYRDEITFRQFGNSKDTTPGYHRTDVRLIWRSESESFWGEVYVRNLENEATKTNQEILASIYRVHYIDAPLNGGLRIGYSY